MNTSPLLSVILPVHNAEKYIFKTIQSILTQSFKDFELLIFDDGSTDSTSQIIKSITDQRIKLLSDGENKGYVDRLNNLLTLATGVYIARMDADDICNKNRFKKQIDFLNYNKECDVVGTYANTFYFKTFLGFLYALPTSNLQIEAYLLFDSALVHPSIMLRSQLVTNSIYFYKKGVLSR